MLQECLDVATAPNLGDSSNFVASLWDKKTHVILLKNIWISKGDFSLQFEAYLANRMLEAISSKARNLIQLDGLAGANVIILADSDGVSRPTYKDGGGHVMVFV